MVIVGAGPAGSSAAHFLARAGVRALLLDKARFPRDKVCGDGCTPRTARMLERVGIRQQISASHQRIDQVYLVSPGGVVLHSPLPEQCFGGVGYAVPRFVLDNLLLQNALAGGAEFRPNTAIRSVSVEPGNVRLVTESGETILARVVIGCDGAYSTVRRAMGAEPNAGRHGAWAIRAYYEDVEIKNPRAFELCWDRELLPAYGWLFPVGPGKANVGLGIRADYLARMGRKLPELFGEYLARDPHIGAEVRGGRLVGKPRGHFLPMGTWHPRTYGERVLLAGDAAAFINPLTGEGIEFALESGELAAQTVQAALAGGDFSARGLSSYEGAWMEAFGHTLRVNGSLQWIFRFPRMVDRIFRVAGRNEAVKDELAELMVGQGRRLSAGLLWKLVWG